MHRVLPKYMAFHSPRNMLGVFQTLWTSNSRLFLSIVWPKYFLLPQVAVIKLFASKYFWQMLHLLLPAALAVGPFWVRRNKDKGFESIFQGASNQGKTNNYKSWRIRSVFSNTKNTGYYFRLSCSGGIGSETRVNWNATKLTLLTEIWLLSMNKYFPKLLQTFG